MDTPNKGRQTLQHDNGARLPTTYEPLKFVLGEIEHLHKELRALVCDFVSIDGSDPRAEYFCTYWDALEQKRVAALNEYCIEGDEQLLATWVQFIPIEDLIGTLKKIAINRQTEGMDIDDLWSALADFNQHLVEFYRKLGRSSSVDRIETFFSNLANQTEKEGIRLSWSMRME